MCPTKIIKREVMEYLWREIATTLSISLSRGLFVISFELNERFDVDQTGFLISENRIVYQYLKVT